MKLGAEIRTTTMNHQHPPKWIVPIGASSGGVSALRILLPRLSRDLDAAWFVVVHVSAEWPSNLPKLLSEQSAIPTHHAVDGEAILSGRVYVAPPRHHLALEPGHVRLDDGPKENFVRPAVDVLFRSAAKSYREAVIGVVLSGGGADGAAGLASISEMGGVGIVQDPISAVAPGMPTAARASARHVAAIEDIAPLLVDLMGHPSRGADVRGA